MSGMPEAVQKAPTTVKEAYRFTVANPEAVKNVPCYCGCGTAGHTSNYSCYVKEVKPSGEVVFDEHALGCSICVDITQDVMKMTQAGKTPKEIRAAIDSTHSKYGLSNNMAHAQKPTAFFTHYGWIALLAIIALIVCCSRRCPCSPLSTGPSIRKGVIEK